MSRRLFIASVVAFHAIAVSGRAQQSVPAGPAIAYVNGRWLTAQGAFQRGNRYAVNGVFVSARPTRVDTTIDLAGGYVTPAFGDAHTHNLDGTFNIDQVRDAYVREGTLYVQVLANTKTGADQVFRRFNRRCELDVAYANGALTSTLSHPFLAYEPRAMGLYSDWSKHAAEIRRSRRRENDAYWFIDSLADLHAKWPRFLEGRPDLVKIILLDATENPPAQPDSGLPEGRGLRPSLVPEIVRLAHSAGIRVVAHVETANDFGIAVRSGVDVFAHLPGYEMPATEDPKRYLIADADAAIAGARRVVITPTISLAGVLAARDSGTAIVETRRRLHRANLALLARHGARIAIGSDWYGQTAWREIAAFDSLGIMSVRQIAHLWMETPALIFPGRRIGRLEPGYEATFLVFPDNPFNSLAALKEIRLRVKQGCTVTPS